MPLPTGPDGQGVQRVPQELTEKLVRHWPLHSWLPGLHCTPQLVPLQVATPPGGAGHGVHDVPQVAVEVSDTQALPH